MEPDFRLGNVPIEHVFMLKVFLLKIGLFDILFRNNE